MSVIYSILCTLFLSTTILSHKAPADVYSATIYNSQDSPIQCHIVWSKPEGQTLKSNLFTIANKQNYFTNEQIINMGTWEARAVIQEIHCGNLVLTAPFDGVESPKTNWEFVVTPYKIISGRSISHVHNY